MKKEQALKIQKLIDSLWLCHHKAQRHVELIVQAIGEGQTTKSYLGQEAKKLHPATWMWENAITVLGTWLTGNTAGLDKLNVGPHAGWKLIGALEDRNRIKLWQVERLVARLKAASLMYPGCEYYSIVGHPEKYADFEEYREPTQAAIIHDTVDGAPAEMSLAEAIDSMDPPNWNFAENLLLVLRAINGNLKPHNFFAYHGRNLKLNPIADRMRLTASTLRAFYSRPLQAPIDAQMLECLGERTPNKRTLAAMLEARISEAFGRARQAAN